MQRPAGSSAPGRSSVVAAILATALLAALVPAVAAAQGSGTALVPTTWDCTNGDILEFSLPAVAVSPGKGALVAPFPGFLTAVDVVGQGQPVPPLGTYVVLALVTNGVPMYVGHKSGLWSGALTCTLEGTPVTVIIAHAG